MECIGRYASIHLSLSSYPLCYRKLIAQHLADLHTCPNEVLSTLQEGGFVASLSDRPWHSVALDEAHKMKINKECKTSIVHPSRDYIHRVASYVPYRAKCLENLREQRFPEDHAPNVPTSIFALLTLMHKEV